MILTEAFRQIRTLGGGFLHFRPRFMQLVAHRSPSDAALGKVPSPTLPWSSIVHDGDGMNAEQQLSPAPARRARPPKRKTRITIYLDDEVLKEFRALSERCGTGYQTLINAALRTGLDDVMVPGALA
jgi:uncharacterized protein (DUF4415 family)